MYTTRRLSSYRSSQGTDAAPLEGPHAGVLLIHDEAWPTVTTRVRGRERQVRDTQIRRLPFPQDMTLSLTYTCMYYIDSDPTITNHVLFLPVLGQPLSANRYYAIWAEGRAKGKACTCSTAEHTETICCCCPCSYTANDLPIELDFRDINQQVEMVPCRSGRFYARSVAPDGVAPAFLRGVSEGTEVRASAAFKYRLLAADGVNAALRARLPGFDFPIDGGGRPEAVVVGKWYCPFVFVKERHLKLKDQMKNSTFYEMTLDQSWVQICRRESAASGGDRTPAVVARRLRTEDALLWGRCAVKEERPVQDGFVHFTPADKKEHGVALSLAIVERVRWEEERAGWVAAHDGATGRVEWEEEPEEGETRRWRFGCYMLVERFLLRRMDGTLVLTWEFRHTHQIRPKWEYV